MKKRSIKLITVAAALALSAILSGCTSTAEQESEETVTVGTKAEVKELVDDFYGGLWSADPLSMTTLMGGAESSVFVRDGDKMYMEYPDMDLTYYMFVEDGAKYVISDGQTAVADELAYDMWADTIEDSLDMFVMGVFEEDFEEEDSFTFTATRTDRTAGGVSSSELVYVVTVTDDGVTATLTVTGKADGDGKVSEILYDIRSDGETYSSTLRFSYDASVTIPEHTFDSSAYAFESAGAHVNSPYRTLNDVIETVGEDESLFYFMDDERVYVITEKDGRQYQLTADISVEDRDAYDALDLFDDDYQEQVYAILGKLEVGDCVDFTDLLVPQSELDSYVGRTAAELVDAGFEGTGWSIWDGNAVLSFEKDLMVYEAKASVPEDFEDENDFDFEDLYGFVVEEISFSEPTYAILPIQ